MCYLWSREAKRCRKAEIPYDIELEEIINRLKDRTSGLLTFEGV